jgi:1,3-beta-galactosyl-N-acetylhexosamine phosphorylase
MSTGRLTMPTEVGAEAETAELIRRLGADAVRNSDGTTIPPEFTELGLGVYSKYFLNRGDRDWAASHPEDMQELYLMSRPVTARGPEVAIPLLAGYFTAQLRIDLRHDPKKWWEVIDRTTGAVVPPENWEYVETSPSSRAEANPSPSLRGDEVDVAIQP